MLVIAAALVPFGLAAAYFLLRWQAGKPAQASENGAITIAFASQTGRAEQIARQSARVLSQGGRPVQVKELGSLRIADIRNAGTLLVIVSTYGFGEAPDSARAFARKYLGKPARLGGLRFALLALGDRNYPNFCQFGNSVDRWLRDSCAQALFNLIEVNADYVKEPLRTWYDQLLTLKGASSADPWDAQAYAGWNLAERHPLNPGSPTEAYHLAFTPLDKAELGWKAGDIAVIAPRQAAAEIDAFLDYHDLQGDQKVLFHGRTVELREALAGSELPDRPPADWYSADADLAQTLRPLQPREYSIASIPQTGKLELLVRRLTLPNGKLSIASGYLTRDIEIGDQVSLHFRSNPTFHPPLAAAPMILIGAGTGIAGLRAHLQHRQAKGIKGAWLIFGERSSSLDRFYADEISAWQKDGTLADCNFCFSRDGVLPAYVQELIGPGSAKIRQLVKKKNAAIFVCGRLEMGTAVHLALAKVLGESTLDRLVSEGRYRRDVY